MRISLQTYISIQTCTKTYIHHTSAYIYVSIYPSIYLISMYVCMYYTSTPQLPFKEAQISSNGDHKALDRGTLGGVGIYIYIHYIYIYTHRYMEPFGSEATPCSWLPSRQLRALALGLLGSLCLAQRLQAPPIFKDLTGTIQGLYREYIGII